MLREWDYVLSTSKCLSARIRGCGGEGDFTTPSLRTRSPRWLVEKNGSAGMWGSRRAVAAAIPWATPRIGRKTSGKPEALLSGSSWTSVNGRGP